MQVAIVLYPAFTALDVMGPAKLQSEGIPFAMTAIVER